MLKAGHIPRKYFIWPFLPPYMEVIPNQKMAFIFPILCILVLPFPFFFIYFPKCDGKDKVPTSQRKLLPGDTWVGLSFAPRGII